MRFKACPKSNLRDRFVKRLQISCRTFQAQPPDVLLHWFANQTPENPMKMKTRKGRRGGYLFQFQFIVQMLLYVNQSTQDPLMIILRCYSLHDRTIRAAP